MDLQMKLGCSVRAHLRYHLSVAHVRRAPFPLAPLTTGSCLLRLRQPRLVQQPAHTLTDAALYSPPPAGPGLLRVRQPQLVQQPAHTLTDAAYYSPPLPCRSWPITATSTSTGAACAAPSGQSISERQMGALPGYMSCLVKV